MLLGGPTILEAVSLIDTHRKSWITKDNTYEGIVWGDDESIPRPCLLYTSDAADE